MRRYLCKDFFSRDCYCISILKMVVREGVGPVMGISDDSPLPETGLKVVQSLQCMIEDDGAGPWRRLGMPRPTHVDNGDPIGNPAGSRVVVVKADEHFIAGAALQPRGQRDPVEDMSRRDLPGEFARDGLGTRLALDLTPPLILRLQVRTPTQQRRDPGGHVECCGQLQHCHPIGSKQRRVVLGEGISKIFDGKAPLARVPRRHHVGRHFVRNKAGESDELGSEDISWRTHERYWIKAVGETHNHAIALDDQASFRWGLLRTPFVRHACDHPQACPGRKLG